MFSVVLGDANVLYSRVLRDYILYAMTHQLIRLRAQPVANDANEVALHSRGDREVLAPGGAHQVWSSRSSV